MGDLDDMLDDFAADPSSELLSYDNWLTGIDYRSERTPVPTKPRRQWYTDDGGESDLAWMEWYEEIESGRYVKYACKQCGEIISHYEREIAQRRIQQHVTQTCGTVKPARDVLPPDAEPPF